MARGSGFACRRAAIVASGRTLNGEEPCRSASISCLLFWMASCRSRSIFDGLLVKLSLTCAGIASDLRITRWVPLIARRFTKQLSRAAAATTTQAKCSTGRSSANIRTPNPKRAGINTRRASRCCPPLTMLRRRQARRRSRYARGARTTRRTICPSSASSPCASES